MGEHKAAVRLVGLRHAKKGSTIAEALETIGRIALRSYRVARTVSCVN
jgi:hypothetical protein